MVFPLKRNSARVIKFAALALIIITITYRLTAKDSQHTSPDILAARNKEQQLQLERENNLVNRKKKKEEEDDEYQYVAPKKKPVLVDPPTLTTPLAALIAGEKAAAAATANAIALEEAKKIEKIRKEVNNKGANEHTSQEQLHFSDESFEYVRENATFVSLARNKDVWSLAQSMRHIEDRFNHKFNYDWVFLNDEPFDDTFINVTTSVASGKTHYGLIPVEHWSYPDWIDQDKAAEARKNMSEKKIIYGGSVPYRHMCRYESGFFWRHPLMNQFKYYWRVEPGIRYYCDIDYDVFKFMSRNKYKYGFTISIHEYQSTIPTLWNSTRQFMELYPQYLAPDNLLEFLSDDKGETYNRCHYWSNFEVGDLDFWRDAAYTQYFDHLDHAGGFFYERWGDAPVHSIAASLFLNKDEVHFFDDIGYYHVPFHSCPTALKDRTEKKCICNPADSSVWKGYSCTPKFLKIKGLLEATKQGS